MSLFYYIFAVMSIKKDICLQGFDARDLMVRIRKVSADKKKQ